MEAEICKIRYCTAVFLLSANYSAGSETVCAIRHNSHTTDSLLDAGGQITKRRTVRFERSEQILLPLHDFKNPVIVANNTAEIHKDDRLGLLGYRCFQGVIIHLWAMCTTIPALLNIHKLHCCTAVNGSRRRSGI